MVHLSLNCQEKPMKEALPKPQTITHNPPFLTASLVAPQVARSDSKQGPHLPAQELIEQGDVEKAEVSQKGATSFTLLAPHIAMCFCLTPCRWPGKGKAPAFSMSSLRPGKGKAPPSIVRRKRAATGRRLNAFLAFCIDA